MMKRSMILAYGVLCYVVFFATFLYTIGFVANVGVPRSIDSAPTGRLQWSLLIDGGLMLLFALQHSGMARSGFKSWLARYLPTPVERSTYVFASSVALGVLFVLWRPLGGLVWSVEEPTAVVAINVLCVLGWLLVLGSSFLINHFDLFGLRQVWSYFISAPYLPLQFKTPGPYRIVRHPLYVGFILAFWSAPKMTATHLLFALAMTAYILLAIRLEERDLVAGLGDAYRAYRLRVPMIVPFARRISRGG